MIQIITRYGNLLLLAMGQTLLLALCGLFFACILGMFFGLLSVLKNKACRIISSIFVDVIRGVPMIAVSYTHLTLPTTSRRQRQMCIRDSYDRPRVFYLFRCSLLSEQYDGIQFYPDSTSGRNWSTLQRTLLPILSCPSRHGVLLRSCT